MEKGEEKFDANLTKNLLGIGIPMGLQFSITAIGSIMLQSANNALGTACVAAFTAAMRIKMFFICPFETLGIAMATYVGQNYGAGKPGRVGEGIKSSVLMMSVYAIFTFTVLMLFSHELLYLFVSPSETEIIRGAWHPYSSPWSVCFVFCVTPYKEQVLPIWPCFPA